jgi:hypothetical protein
LRAQRDALRPIAPRCAAAAGRLRPRRDKADLDAFWLKDESLEDAANLPPPEVIAREIVEDLQAALEQFAAIAEANGEE